MNAKKNVAIGKIGKTVKFKDIKISQGAGPDITFYSLISRMNPEYNFYFIGPNTLDKLTKEEYDYIFPNHNVYSAYAKSNDALDEPYQTILDKLDAMNVKFDFGMFFSGMCSQVNVPKLLKKDDGSDYSILCAYKNYVGPYIYVMNKLMIPWYTLSEDARYITIHARDLVNRERLSFSQINANLECSKRINSLDDIYNYTYDTVEAVYCGLEKIFLNGIKSNWKDDIDVEHKLNNTGNHVIVLSNGCGTTKIDHAGNNSSRIETYKKWVIDLFKNTKYESTKIYGMWDKNIYEEYPDNVQDKLMLDAMDEVADAKYTLVYSQIPGFVTAKPWEMITLGIIPFLHPDYDKYNLLHFPEYLYLKSPEDFLNKIEELEANPEKYKALLYKCFDLIKEDDMNGSNINNFIFSRIGDDLGFDYEKKPGVTSIFNRFDKDMFTVGK